MTLSLLIAAAASIATKPESPTLKTSSTMSLEASYQDYGSSGARRLLESRMKLQAGDATIVVTPKMGTRSGEQRDSRGYALSGDLYLPLTSAISSRTSVQLANRSAAFARIDASQQLTVGVARRTNVQVGIRYAKFDLGDEVTFLSGGVRQYFSFGSVAYTLTAAKAEGGKTGLGHMIQASLNDGPAGGSTQLWLSMSKGAQEFEWARNDRSTVRSVVIRRLQPVAGPISLVGKVGLAQYRSPANRHTGLIAGVGIEYRR